MMELNDPNVLKGYALGALALCMCDRSARDCMAIQIDFKRALSQGMVRVDNPTHALRFVLIRSLGGIRSRASIIVIIINSAMLSPVD
jgi:hypothetical protein